jgi:hypothetical protein
MLAALVVGEREPNVLPDLAKGRLRRTIPEAARSHGGRFRGALIGMCVVHSNYLDSPIRHVRSA